MTEISKLQGMWICNLGQYPETWVLPDKYYLNKEQAIKAGIKALKNFHHTGNTEDSDNVFGATPEMMSDSFTVGQGVPVGIPQMADDILDNMGERVCEEVGYDLAGNYLTNIPEEDIEDLNNVITNWIVAKGYSPNYYLCEHAEVITIDE